jgi:hypothetical protein
MHPRSVLLLACGSILGGGCAEYDMAVRSHASLDDAKESRCNVVKDHSRPLIVEWPASARGDLEVRMKKAVVAVRYVGCAMEVLDRCSAGGTYRYVPFTPKEDRLVIRDSKDLFANLPMGAAGLEAKLAKLGEIDLGMTLVGKYEADAMAASREEDLHGDCSEATHVVTGMTVGAFALSAGGVDEVGGGATVMGAGMKASARVARETLSRDGDPRMCDKATLDDTTPPRWCGAVVRVEVVPVARALRSAYVDDHERQVLARLETDTSTLPALPVPEVAPPLAAPPRRARRPSDPPPVLGFRTDRDRPAKPPPPPCDGASDDECMARCWDGSAPSCLTLAHAHAHAKDQTYWLLSACIAGNAEGCSGVGKAYARGEFGDPDELTAEKWYGIAAKMPR